MNVLRIYFSAQWRDSDSPCPWALCDQSGAVLQQGLSPLAAMPATRECIGILSADRVLIVTAPQPPGAKRRWPATLPFIAEEHTLTDPDDTHATFAASSEPGMITLSVVSKSWLRQIVSATAAAGLPLRRLLSESLLPALQADSWTLVWNGRDGFLHTSATTGLALDCGDPNTAPLALLQSLAAPGVRMPQKIELRIAEPATDLPSWELPVPLAAGNAWDWRHAPISEQTPNLLAGEFTPPLQFLEKLSRLRPALFILFAAFAVEVAGTHLEWLMLAHEKNGLTHNVERIFHGTFGEDSTLIDAPLQMQRNLTALRHAAGAADDSDFLAMMDTVAPSLGSLNNGAIRSLNYDSGKLGLDIKLANPAAFQELAKKLQLSGLNIRTSDMHDLGDGTQARLTLTPEGLR